MLALPKPLFPTFDACEGQYNSEWSTVPVQELLHSGLRFWLTNHQVGLSVLHRLLPSITLAITTMADPSFSFAQDATAQQARASIVGTVVNGVTQRPLAGATVAVVGTPRGAITDSLGRFRITDVPPGIVVLTARLVGFEPTRVADVAVGPGKPATVTIAMVEQPRQTADVVVRASAFSQNGPTATSTQRLTAEEVRRAPGVQEDVVRAVALLPGVAVTQAGRNDLAVRGGAPFENLFLVDNIEVPNINHFGSQGSTGGPLSIINIDFVSDVSLSTGGFGPRYGDRLSSVTDITLRRGNSERFAGEFNLSATGVGLIAEGPMSTSGTYMVSVRRSYLDLIFGLAGFSFIPEYYDLTAKVTYDLDADNSLSFLTIGALGTVRFNNDDSDALFDNARVTAPSQNQYMSGLSWKHLFSNGFLTTTIGRTFTSYRTTQQDSTGAIVFRNNSTEGENSLRTDLVWVPSPALDVTAGIIGKYASTLTYDVNLPGYARLDAAGVPTPLAVDTTWTAARVGIYGNVAWTFADAWQVGIGGRLDYYGFLDTRLYAAPRLSLRYRVSETTSLTASAGRYVQAPQFIWLIGDRSNGSSLEPIVADQVVLSWQHLVDDDWKFQVETYYKEYHSYPVRQYRPQAVLSPSGFDDITTDIPFGLEPIAMRGNGRTLGAELFVQKKLSASLPFYGLASVSANMTRFTTPDDRERAGAFDSPFIATLAIGWRPNDVWEVSSKLRTSAGLPTTPYIDNATLATQRQRPLGSLDFERYNEGPRTPTFVALDLRADRRWFFDGWQLITYIDIQNVTGRKNVSGYRWNSRLAAVEAQESIGILPSIGINVEF